MRENEGGVSEAIGYIIIFGLVMTGIGLITLYGYPVLMKQESSANIKNMEQTMIVLQNDMKSLTYKLVPYKETTLRVSGGTLTLFNKSLTRQKFSVYRESAPGSPIWGEFQPGELRFESDKDNTVITLENGAVIERQVGITGSFMLAQPRWYMDTYAGQNTLVINYISLDNISTAEIKVRSKGVGTVRMRHFQTLFTNDQPGEQVRIQYESVPEYDYSRAWYNFLTDPNGLDMEEVAPAGSGIYRTRQNVDNIVVKEYDLVIEEL
ncbi:MAG: hypothetical protein LUQ62_02860 [Methanomicrobiales archaeon]|nr:hypothetical protein [Methanomicrobiales archaeon]